VPEDRIAGENLSRASDATLMATMLFWQNIFKKNQSADIASRCYGELLEQARNPVFFTSMGVPDSLDGRFEILCLHAFLIFHKLRNFGEPGRQLAQEIYDQMFASFDADLRELGAADIGVGRRIKAMTEGLNGRIQGYENGLAMGGDALKDAIRRNVFATVQSGEADVARLADYLERAVGDMANKGFDDILNGPLVFPSLNV
jgi:cytochrome b pre-mRNA-processing protein 3